MPFLGAEMWQDPDDAARLRLLDAERAFGLALGFTGLAVAWSRLCACYPAGRRVAAWLRQPLALS